MTRDLDGQHGYEPIDCIRSVDANTLEMIDANARVLEQSRDVVDRGVIRISVERCLSGVRARVRELGGGYNTRLCCRVANEPVAPKVISTTSAQLRNPGADTNTDPSTMILCWSMGDRVTLVGAFEKE